MKKYLPIIPVLAIFISIMVFYFNKTTQIHKQESELKNLRELSLEVEMLYKNYQVNLLNVKKNVNKDSLATSNREFTNGLKNYLDVLANLDYGRLYRLSNIMSKKNSAMQLAYEDLKTDSAALYNSMLWSSRSLEAYLTKTSKLSKADKRFIYYLYSEVLNSSISEVIAIKNMSGVRHTDALNRHLREIHETQINLANSFEEVRKNDILKEINEVILFTFEKSNELTEETKEMIHNLLMIVGFLLLLAFAVYVKQVKEAAELRKVKHDLNEFVEALDEGAIVSKSDLTGKITYVNDKFCEISGYTKEELIGKQHNIIRHPDMKAEVFKNLWDTIKKGEIYKGSIKNRAKDGSAYYVATTVIPMHNEEGVVDTYLSVRYDITGFVHNI